MIKTPDKRKFLVGEKNLQAIIEYVKTFKAEIYKVEVIEGKIINQLKSLAGAICNGEFDCNAKIKVLKKIYPRSKPRQNILNNAKKIKDFISKKFSNGDAVSLKSLKNKYKGCEITDACLCNHLSAVRKELAETGHKIKKIGQGTYQIECSK